jgi:hypothetical protein
VLRGEEQLGAIIEEGMYSKIVTDFAKSHPDQVRRLKYLYEAQQRFAVMLAACGPAPFNGKPATLVSTGPGIGKPGPSPTVSAGAPRTASDGLPGLASRVRSTAGLSQRWPQSAPLQSGDGPETARRRFRRCGPGDTGPETLVRKRARRRARRRSRRRPLSTVSETVPKAVRRRSRKRPGDGPESGPETLPEAGPETVRRRARRRASTVRRRSRKRPQRRPL